MSEIDCQVFNNSENEDRRRRVEDRSCAMVIGMNARQPPGAQSDSTVCTLRAKHGVSLEVEDDRGRFEIPWHRVASVENGTFLNPSPAPSSGLDPVTRSAACT